VGAVVVLLAPDPADVAGRLSRGCARWLALGGGFELLSALGYVVLFTMTFCARTAWRGSSRIALGALGAGTVLPAGGVTGPAMGAWFARRNGEPTPSITARVTAFVLLTNAPSVIVLGGLGFGLWAGWLAGPRCAVLTLVPATVALGLATGALILPLGSRGSRASSGRGGRLSAMRAWQAVGQGLGEAKQLLRGRSWKLLGAVANYAGDNAVLWATFRAFGHSPSVSVIVMAYIVGGLASALPLPGGFGGLEAGLVGTLVLYGAPAAPAAAAVLAYRVISVGVPLTVGGIAWHRLRPEVAPAAGGGHGVGVSLADHSHKASPLTARGR
jgi:uncharacterized membrane protein YbhN (UPF0104 family)